jgi:putative flippase GtrA
MHKFIKFGIFSGSGWLLDCSLLLFLSQIVGTPLFAANFISSSIAAITVFTISRFYVFQSTESYPLLKTFVYFCYTCGVIIAASVIIGPIAWLSQHTATYFSINPTIGQISFIAKVLITPPQLLANYFMARYLSENQIIK